MPAQYFQIEAPRTCRLSEGNDPPIPHVKRKKEIGGKKCEEEIAIINQTEEDSRSLHFSYDLCVSVFLFATYPYVDGASCRFAGHVRNVNYQNTTRNDRQIELVGTCWCPACKEHGESEGTEGGGGGDRDESTSENYESS